MKKTSQKSININAFLYLGVALIVITTVLNLLIESIPSGVLTVLYLMGILALVLYMWEIQYRRRTGDYNDEGTPTGKKKKK